MEACVRLPPSSREPTQRQTLASDRPRGPAAYSLPLTYLKILRARRLCWLECRPELRNHGAGWMRAVERLRNGGVPRNPVFLMPATHCRRSDWISPLQDGPLFAAHARQSPCWRTTRAATPAAARTSTWTASTMAYRPAREGNLLSLYINNRAGGLIFHRVRFFPQIRAPPPQPTASPAKTGLQS